MPWFCNDGHGDGEKKKKECDGCFPSKAGSPIVVKIARPINNVNANRMNYGNRFASRGGAGVGGGAGFGGDACCKWCNHKAYANRMVSNQNRIVNFDLINRINDARANGVSPNTITYSPSAPNAPPEKRKCDNCIKILREKELELLRKEQEILKIKTHFTSLPKSGAQTGLGANCEHCFKALREKEFELFKKEQEIAKMRAAAWKNPIDTQAKVDKARCANCFKLIRQKELELLKKEHALMKNMTRPNINVKNFNYCSCCRDNKKGTINKLKKDEELRKKNRDNCFKALRMKEIQLLQKERELDQKLQKFREESIAKAKRDLEKVPDPRLVVPTKENKIIKCVCSCTKSNELKEDNKAKGVCKIVQNVLPVFLGGRTKDAARGPSGDKSVKGAMVFQKERTCPVPCCALKLARNFTSYMLAPPRTEKSKKKLPASCSFMKLVTWCGPGHLQDSNVIKKCCTILTKEKKESPAKREKREKIERIKAEKEKKAVAKAIDKATPESWYRVETIGQIRPKKPKSEAKLDVIEAEVLRTYGAEGLKKYRTKLVELDPEAAKAYIAKEMPKVSKSKMDKYAAELKKYSTKAPKKSESTVYESGMPKKSKSGAKSFDTEASKGYGTEAKKFKQKIQGFRSREGALKKSTSRSGGGETSLALDSKKPKKFDFKTPKAFKTKDQDTRAVEKFKTKVGYGETKLPEKHKAVGYGKTGSSSSKTGPSYGKTGPSYGKSGPSSGKTGPGTVKTEATSGKTRVGFGKTDEGYGKPGMSSSKAGIGLGKVIKKYKTAAYGETEKPSQYRAAQDKTVMDKAKGDYGEDASAIRKKYKTKIGENEVEGPRKSGTNKVYDEYEAPSKSRTKVGIEDDEEPSRRKRKIYDDDYEIPKKRKSKIYDTDYDEPRIRRSKAYDDYDEAPRTPRSRRSIAYDENDDVDWIMGVSREREKSYKTGFQAPPLPPYVKILGRSLVYCAGCFIGIPCILFLCLCLLCNSD